MVAGRARAVDMSGKRLTEAQVASLEILGVADIAARIGVESHTVSMRNHRTKLGVSGGWDFPAPHAVLGSCSVWLLTVEVAAAIERHRVDA